MKKAIEIIKKAVLALVVLACFSAMTVGIIYAVVKYQARNDYYTSKYLSKDVEVRCYYNREGKFSIYNEDRKEYTIRDIEWVADVNPSDTFTVFCKNDKRGYINALNGNISIPEQYEKAWVFSNGVAAAMKGGKIGFINSRNEVILPFIYDFTEGVSYVFKEGYCTMSDAKGACGLIDTNGNWALAPQYDCIWSPDSNHLRLVADEGKFGLMTNSFTFAFPIGYDWIATLDDGNYLMVKNGVQKKITPDGTVLQDFIVDGTWEMKYPVGIELSEGEDYRGNFRVTEKVTHSLSDYLGYRIDYDNIDACGVIHAKTGEIIIPAVYDYVEMVSDKLFQAQDLDGYTYVLIDLEGRIIKESRK